MKTIKLMLDHTEWVNGKKVVHKKGDVIQVTEKVYDHIVKAIIDSRTKTREVTATIPGSPEWKARHDR